MQSSAWLATSGKVYVEAGPDESGIRLAAKNQGWKKVAKGLSCELAQAEQAKCNAQLGSGRRRPPRGPGWCKRRNASSCNVFTRNLNSNTPSNERSPDYRNAAVRDAADLRRDSAAAFAELAADLRRQGATTLAAQLKPAPDYATTEHGRALIRRAARRGVRVHFYTGNRNVPRGVAYRGNVFLKVGGPVLNVDAVLDHELVHVTIARSPALQALLKLVNLNSPAARRIAQTYNAWRISTGMGPLTPALTRSRHLAGRSIVSPAAAK